MSFQCQIRENLNKLIPIWYIMSIILNFKRSTAQLTLLEAKMLDDVMLDTQEQGHTILFCFFSLPSSSTCKI